MFDHIVQHSPTVKNTLSPCYPFRLHTSSRSFDASNLIQSDNHPDIRCVCGYKTISYPIIKTTVHCLWWFRHGRSSLLWLAIFSICRLVVGFCTILSGAVTGYLMVVNPEPMSSCISEAMRERSISIAFCFSIGNSLLSSKSFFQNSDWCLLLVTKPQISSTLEQCQTPMITLCRLLLLFKALPQKQYNPI